MDENARKVFDQSLEGLANPGVLGERKMAQLGDATVERRPDREPVPVNVSAEDREIAFLLSYRGDDPGLLWRKANAERERVRQQAIADARAAEASHHTASVDERIAALVAQYREAQIDAQGAAISHERKRHAAELARLELRVDARLHALTKRQIIEADVERREAEVVSLMRRSQLRA